MPASLAAACRYAGPADAGRGRHFASYSGTKDLSLGRGLLVQSCLGKDRMPVAAWSLN